MPLIRALTLMLPHLKDYEVLRDTASKLKQIKELLGNVWTLRFSLGFRLPYEEMKYLTNEGLLINAFHERLTDVRLEELINYLSIKSAYAALGLNPKEDLGNELESVYEVLREIKDKLGPEALTRVGFYIGGKIETPYFPLSFPAREGVSVALRYADILANNSAEKYVELIKDLLITYESRIKAIVESEGLRYLGIDASLSPWMEESVIPIITSVSGTEFPNPGSAYGIRRLNDFISVAVRASGASAVGFNEVMLPVGEDNLIKDLVRQGILRLEHLTFLTSYCVAGVDMVVIDEDKDVVKGVVKDVIAASEVKGKPVGLRLILSDKEEIKLPSFGCIPKIKIGSGTKFH